MNGYHPNGSGPSHNGPSADQVQIPIGPTNQPRVLIRQLDNMNAVFNLSGVETGFANSLRRVIMADVPTICTCTSYISFFLFLFAPPSCHSPTRIIESNGRRAWICHQKWRSRRRCIETRPEELEREIERELMAGIDQVLFTQNTSPIPDEMLAHRLGMVPLISQKVMDGLRYTRVSLSPRILHPRLPPPCVTLDQTLPSG
jgi:hypothetical protein